jgi:hypothetical protein
VKDALRRFGRKPLNPNLRHCPGILLVWAEENYKIVSKYEQCPGHLWKGHMANTLQKLYCLSQTAELISTV